MPLLALSSGVACAGTAGLTAILARVLPNFRSRELKSGTDATDPPGSTARRLPLVGGPAFWLAVTVALILVAAVRQSSSSLILLAIMSGFFLFGLADDVAKSRAGRGVREGCYLTAALILAVGATALVVGTGLPADGARSPFALAHWLGAQRHLLLSGWYLALILGTALAAGFSDGFDGLTAGTLALACAGAAGAAAATNAGLALGPAVAAGASVGALAWNRPSRWSPSNRRAARAARAYLGDSGALAGGALAAAAAIAAGVDLLWPVIAGPLLLEGLASLLQAKLLVPAYRRWRDPRLPNGAPLPHQRFPLPLLTSPLHDHWAKIGTDRLQVVKLFWTCTLATGGAGILAALAWPAASWMAWYGLGAGVVAGFWLAAMWLRPAFLLRVDGRLLLAHGRPWTLGRVRLFRVRGLAGDAAAAEAALVAGLLHRPMNAHRLEELVASLTAPAPMGPPR